MTYTQANTYIRSLRSVGIQMGLVRMESACAALSHPERAFAAVHIAGTNGKGSTAAMIAAIMTAGGYRVGTYTSPYFFDPAETIAINGKPVEHARFSACVQRVANSCPNGLSEYECLTAVAFCCFEEENIDIAVIECCLGGKEDATNVIPPPLCAVFTPIALDHTAILGSTITAITQNKSAIAKPPCPIVCAPTMPEEALAVFFESAAANGQIVHTVYPPPSPQLTAAGTHCVLNEQDAVLPMLGAHQANNAATALIAARVLGQRGLPVDSDTAIAALKTVTMPCRTELLQDGGYTVLLDGAHNPHGIDTLCSVMDAIFDTPVTLVLGMLADKSYEQCIQILSPHCARIICCTPQGTTRALPAEQLAAVARRYCPIVSSIDDPITAYQHAKKSDTRSPIVVGGSFYTASFVRRHLTGR